MDNHESALMESYYLDNPHARDYRPRRPIRPATPEQVRASQDAGALRLLSDVLGREDVAVRDVRSPLSK